MSGGNASTRSTKLCSMRLVSGITCGTPKPPASWAGESPRGSSSSASGFPRVSATIRSRTRSSSGPGITESSRTRASCVGESADEQLRQPGQVAPLAGLAGREHQPDRVRREAARNERQRQRGGAVLPLRVVDHADERALLGGAGEQAEHGDAEQEAVGRRARAQAEGGAQRVALWSRQRVEAVEQRCAQLVQAGERQLHLGLDAGRPHDAAVRRTRHQVLEQRRLADARLAAEHEHLAPAPADGLEQPFECLALAAPAE